MNHRQFLRRTFLLGTTGLLVSNFLPILANGANIVTVALHT